MPEYYKTNKGYYYKITKKGPNKGKKRISKETYEKSIDKKKGSGFLSIDFRSKSKTIIKEYMSNYEDKDNWCDNFYRSESPYDKTLKELFDSILLNNQDKKIINTDESTQEMIFRYYMKILYDIVIDIVKEYKLTKVPDPRYSTDGFYTKLENDINKKLKEDKFFSDTNFYQSLMFSNEMSLGFQNSPEDTKRILLYNIATDLLGSYLKSKRIDGKGNKCEN